jgi:NADPH:quinone reductase-like Zn-dependent oxidoreductase
MIVTASTEEKVARCRALGADLAIQYTEEDFVEQVNAYTGGGGVDIILDIVGADYFDRNLSLLRLQGRMVNIATLSGGQVQLNLGALMGRRLRLIGSVLRSRSLAEKAGIKARFMNRFWTLLEDDTIQPVIDMVFAIEQAEAAHQYMADNKNVGKIILKVR